MRQTGFKYTGRWRWLDTGERGTGGHNEGGASNHIKVNNQEQSRQSAFLNMRSCPYFSLLVDSWNVISLSPSTCSNSKFASREARSKCPDVTWSSHFPEDASEETCVYSGQPISQNAFHQQPETIAEEKINYWQLTFYKYYCCWVTECNFTMFSGEKLIV